MPDDQTAREFQAAIDNYVKLAFDGTSPRLAEYVARYPHLAPDLELNILMQQIENHRSEDGEFEYPYADGEEPAPGYRLWKELGRGGFGRVWLAEPKDRPGQFVALKFLFAGTLQEVEREGVAHTRHSLGESHDACQHLAFPESVREGQRGTGRFYYYEMPLADDALTHKRCRDPIKYCPETLEWHIRNNLKPSAREVLEFGEQAGPALARLHDAGLRHRDVKPENMYRVGSKWVLGDPGLMTQYSSGEPAGTPGYSFPDNPNRNHPVHDAYALVMVLFQYMTCTPYDAKKQSPVSLRTWDRFLLDPCRFSRLGRKDRFAPLLRDLILKGRHGRYGSGRELAVAIKDAIRTPSRKKLSWLAAAIALMLFGALLLGGGQALSARAHDRGAETGFVHGYVSGHQKGFDDGKVQKANSFAINQPLTSEEEVRDKELHDREVGYPVDQHRGRWPEIDVIRLFGSHVGEFHKKVAFRSLSRREVDVELEKLDLRCTYYSRCVSNPSLLISANATATLVVSDAQRQLPDDPAPPGISLDYYRKAVEGFEKAISSDPNNALAWNNLAWALFRKCRIDSQRTRTDLDRAVEAADQALKLTPIDQRADHRLADYLHTGACARVARLELGLSPDRAADLKAANELLSKYIVQLRDDAKLMAQTADDLESRQLPATAERKRAAQYADRANLVEELRGKLHDRGELTSLQFEVLMN